jgi:hypothetical protein
MYSITILEELSLLRVPLIVNECLVLGASYKIQENTLVTVSKVYFKFICLIKHYVPVEV